jgi:hypothetical protein
LNLQLFGHESGGQSAVFAAKNSGEFAAIVCGLVKVTVVEPLVTEAFPGSFTPVR